MMLSKVEARKKIGEASGNGKLLNDVEAISKALYLDKNLPRTSILAPGARSKSTGKSQLFDPKPKPRFGGNEEPSQRDKKSIWNWKPLKAFSNVRNRKFSCCFSLQVHSIEGLPPRFDNVSVCVHWKRRDGELLTRPVKVFEGSAEFEENLMHTCMVHGSRSGPHHSAKYDAKHFLLYASVLGAQHLDLGKHRVDLTRLLPLTLEELEEEKSSGKWTTSFKLSGEAKGATMNVSFGYTVVAESGIPSRNNQNFPESLSLKPHNGRTVKSIPKFDQGQYKSTIRRTESLPGTVEQQHLSSSHYAVKDLHEVLPISKSELPTSAHSIDQNSHENRKDASVDYKPELDVFMEHLEPIKHHSFLAFESSQKTIENVCTNGDFSEIEKGMVLFSDEQDEPEQVTADAAGVSTVKPKPADDLQVAFEEDSELHQQVVNKSCQQAELVVHDCSFEDDVYTKESVMKELECALNNLSNAEREASDSPEAKENYMDGETACDSNRIGSSDSLDDVEESVANEFLEMLGFEDKPFGLSSESEPESPREQLLRQFEKDALAGGYSLFDFDVDDEEQPGWGYNAASASEWGTLAEDFDLSSTIQAAEREHEMGTETANGRARAKTLEDLETEALMREWGFNDKAFQSSPKNSGFGSPIDLSPEEPLELPPLGEGLGPFLQTQNGGFLRSMDPSLFRNAQTGGSLVMQVSSPVVVPAEMGSGIVDVLQHLASVGIEKLSMQANKLMPLEDITGKTIQEVAWEAGASLEGPERQYSLQEELEIGQNVSVGKRHSNGISSAPKSSKFSSSSASNDVGSEYVSLEDLAPLAMNKIEALSVEGLRIQSGMSDEDAPSNISAQSIGEISALHGKGINISGSLGMEGTAGLQLLDIKDNGDDIDGLMGLSLTLDEWMRLDSGDIGDGDEISERTSKILAAHHASSLDLIRGGSKGERRRGKGSGKKCGLLGNNFTVALMVQLRDPLRDYEPVGMPMLALIQVERVFVPPKPKIYCKVSELRNNNEDEDESESVVKEEEKHDARKEKAVEEEEGIPQFQITEVHVAGLQTEPDKKKLWGTTKQQQSGSRWLLANGMGKNGKQPFMKSKAAPTKSTTPHAAKAQPGDTLWSISSRMLGTGAKW